MNDRDKRLLQRNRLALVRGVVVDEDLLSFLMGKHILTEAMKDEIDVKKTKRDKAGGILDLLPRRGPYAFRAFVEGLVETEQGPLADILDGTVADNYRAETGIAAVHYPSNTPTRSPQPIPGRVQAPQKAEGVLKDSIFPNVSKLKNADEALIRGVRADEKANYRMMKKVRGRCIILNIDKFSEESKKKAREGSYTDVTNLTQVFEKLHFVVELWDNLDRAQILKNIKTERKNNALKECDAFVMAILSHGKKDTIFAKDGLEVNITNEIVEKFNGANCDALLYKPKVFFIQACQGDEETIGVVPDDAGDRSEEEDSAMKPQGQDPVHEWADILVVTGTVPGYKAWRHVIEGSWFITDLCVALVEYAHFKHLEDIVTIVSRYVSERKRDKTGQKQICQKRGQLRRDLFFLPGYWEP